MQTASVPRKRCQASRDETATVKNMQAATASNGTQRLCQLNAVMLIRTRPQWYIHANGDCAERQAAIVPRALKNT